MADVQFVHRACAIADAFNKCEYNSEGVAIGNHRIGDDTRKLIAAMLKEKHSNYDATGKKLMLALEVSFIVQAIKTDAGRAYFHRVLQWF